MTDRKPLYTGEAILLNWTDTKSGRKIVLQLEKDGPGAHPFDGLDGERFAVVIVGPLASAEHAEPKNVAGSSKGRTSDFDSDSGGSTPPPASKPKRHWRDMPPSQRAALLTKDPEFQAFACECFDPDAELRFDECTADSWLKAELKIESKADIWGNSFAVAKLEQIEGNFRAWQQAKQHGAA